MGVSYRTGGPLRATPHGFLLQLCFRSPHPLLFPSSFKGQVSLQELAFSHSQLAQLQSRWAIERHFSFPKRL